jgi:GNAT superfamily N-acetyltransferase
MSTITITTVDGMTESDCLAIGRRLTRPGSEFQIEVLQRMSGKMSSATPLALWHERGCLLAWACSHKWQKMQTLEMFTDENHRGRGIAPALSAALIAASVINRGDVLAVFAPVTEAIARRAGFTDVRRFESGWREATGLHTPCG